MKIDIAGSQLQLVLHPSLLRLFFSRCCHVVTDMLEEGTKKIWRGSPHVSKGCLWRCGNANCQFCLKRGCRGLHHGCPFFSAPRRQLYRVGSLTMDITTSNLGLAREFSQSPQTAVDGEI